MPLQCGNEDFASAVRLWRWIDASVVRLLSGAMRLQRGSADVWDPSVSDVMDCSPHFIFTSSCVLHIFRINSMPGP